MTPKGQKRQTGSSMVTWHTRHWQQSIGNIRLCGQKCFRLSLSCSNPDIWPSQVWLRNRRKTRVIKIFDEPNYGNVYRVGPSTMFPNSIWIGWLIKYSHVLEHDPKWWFFLRRVPCLGPPNWGTNFPLPPQKRASSGQCNICSSPAM